MDLFANYLHEREGVEVLQTPDGFAIYSIQGSECYLRDIYIQPKARKSGLASIIANKIQDIAKGKGCTVMTGSVSPSANNSTDSIKVLLAYGMKVVSASNNFIIFSKDIV